MTTINTTPNPLFVSIAKILGCTIVIRRFDNGNTGEIDFNRAEFVTPEGNKFYVITGGYYYKNKLHFSISFPDHVVNEKMETRGTSQSAFMPYGTPHFDGINVAATKTPEQIAKDVQRRLFPTAYDLWATCAVWCDQQSNYYSNKATLSNEVHELLKPFGYNKGKVRADVKYIGKDNATIELAGLSIEQIRKLAKFLETM